MKHIIVATFLIFGCLALASPSIQALSFNIDPPSIYLKGKPGEILNQRISIENTSTENIEMHAYLQNWRYEKKSGGSSKVFLEPQSDLENRFGIAPFVKLFAESFYLKPGEIKDLVFRVTVPADGKGSLAGVVFFEGSAPGGSTTGTQKTNVKFVARLGSIIYLDVQGTELRNLAFDVQTGIAKNKLTQLDVTVSNRGNTHEMPKGNLLLLDKSKSVVDRFLLPDIRLFPDEKTRFSVFGGPYKSGEYTLILAYTSGEKLVSKEIKVSIP